MNSVKSKTLAILAPIFVLALLQGCADGDPYADLDEFMADARNAPAGEIDPLPTSHPYKTFAYSSAALRSPFEAPLILAESFSQGIKSSVKPDESRKKEYLEAYNFAALAMVGTLKKNDQIWSLINDGDGGIHRVKIGDYMGKNHGRIIRISVNKLNVIEIVPDGRGGWVERPRTLSIREQE